MSRALTIVERVIADAERAAYLAALPLRKQQAASVPAHFWVFEHATDRGRFIEFTESDENQLNGSRQLQPLRSGKIRRRECTKSHQ
jgi:hypothetical protein